MDLDPSRATGHDEHIDEDIIEYDLDTDILDETDKDWTTQDLDIKDVDEHTEQDQDVHDHMETIPDDTTEHHADAMDTMDPLPFSGTSAHDADMISDLGHEDHVIQEDPVTQNLNVTIEEAVVDETAGNLNISGHDEIQEEHPMDHDELRTDDQVDEIDFGDATEEVEVETSEEIPAITSELVASEIEADNGQDVVNPSAADVVIEPKPTDNSVVPPGEEELTWEEDDDDTRVNHVSSHGEDETEHQDPAEPIDQNDQPSATIDEDVHVEQSSQKEERTGTDTGALAPDHVAPELSTEDDQPEQPTLLDHEEMRYPHVETQEEVPELVHEEQADLAQADAQHEADEDISYPSITVQYKGEEFPCFAASEGFFTNTSVLTESMEMLLAWFRAELAEEIASDEELVFHIDELGLEFSEVCLPSSCTPGTSLTGLQSSQHDLLSSTTLQYIMEIHDMLVQNQDHDDDPGAKNLYTYLFTRSSTGKRLEFLAESAAAGKGLDEVIHLFEPGMTHHEDGTEQSSEVTAAILDELGDDYPSPGDERPEANVAQVKEADQAATDDLHEVSFDVTATEAVVENEDPVADLGTVAAQRSTPTAEENGLMSEDAEPSNAHSVATPETDNLETQEDHDASELEALDGNPGPTERADDGTHGTDPPTATSTSSTVDGNEITPVAAIDDAVEHTDDQTTLVHPLNGVEDDFAEIDWREDGDLEEEHDATDDQATPAKRARTDDELGLDQENGKLALRPIVTTKLTALLL